MLKRLRVNPANPNFRNALRGADQKLKSGAVNKFGYEKANMIWLPNQHGGLQENREN